jgi:hypothetical protein
MTKKISDLLDYISLFLCGLEGIENFLTPLSPHYHRSSSK